VGDGIGVGGTTPPAPTRPYYDTARREVEDFQGLTEASYYVARSSYQRGDLRRAVGLQQAARIAAAASRAAYQAWTGPRCACGRPATTTIAGHATCGNDR
jgi:hypothetical protein